MISNPFANYTLSITTQYHDTKARVEEAQKQPPEKDIQVLNQCLKNAISWAQQDSEQTSLHNK